MWNSEEWAKEKELNDFWQMWLPHGQLTIGSIKAYMEKREKKTETKKKDGQREKKNAELVAMR
jgi:hypothetical protein